MKKFIFIFFSLVLTLKLQAQEIKFNLPAVPEKNTATEIPDFSVTDSITTEKINLIFSAIDDSTASIIKDFENSLKTEEGNAVSFKTISVAQRHRGIYARRITMSTSEPIQNVKNVIKKISNNELMKLEFKKIAEKEKEVKNIGDQIRSLPIVKVDGKFFISPS